MAIDYAGERLTGLLSLCKAFDRVRDPRPDRQIVST